MQDIPQKRGSILQFSLRGAVAFEMAGLLHATSGMWHIIRQQGEQVAKASQSFIDVCDNPSQSCGSQKSEAGLPRLQLAYTSVYLG